jgi:hypothetical protein
LENAVHGVNGTNFASHVDARDEEKRITLAHKEIRPTPLDAPPRMLSLNSSIGVNKSAAHTKRCLTACCSQRILSQVIRLVDPRPTHFNERGIMQETAVRNNPEVTRESDDNEGTDVIGTHSIDELEDEVAAIENREPDTVGGEDEEDEEDTVGGEDEDDEEDTVGGEDE